MSIDLLPDALNFGKNSRDLLSSGVMPLLNSALQQVMLQLPTNPAYHVAQFLRQNNRANGAALTEVQLPAIFMSKKDADALAIGALRLDDFDLQLSRAAARAVAASSTSSDSDDDVNYEDAHDDDEEREQLSGGAVPVSDEQRVSPIVALSMKRFTGCLHCVSGGPVTCA